MPYVIKLTQTCIQHVRDVHAQIVEAPAIKEMVNSGQKVPEISLISSARGTPWKLENQCLVNLRSCKSGENTRFKVHIQNLLFYHGDTSS